jgi:hypothetical protein
LANEWRILDSRMKARSAKSVIASPFEHARSPRWWSRSLLAMPGSLGAYRVRMSDNADRSSRSLKILQ